MFGGLLAFLGIYAGSAAKAAYDNHEMKNYTRTVDKDGNVHYMDRLCNDYINGERVKRVETTDRNGVKLYSTVGVNSSKVYDTSYGRGTQQLFAMSDQNKQRAIEYGDLAYMQYNPYFERQVTTEIATGRTITCLFEGKDPETNEPFYKKWYFRPECQDKYDWRNTVKGDYGIDISKEEYYKLKTVLSSYTSIPSDREVAWKLMNIK
ncbi:MAG TPA: hypothetical protein DCW90_06800 [Lachnospiraceae bacterium]|nr:hypothetical protein [Lachnospiraceae bacterium]